MINDFISKIDYNRNYMSQEYYNDWEEIHTRYANKQDLKDKSPNSRVNILHANVEGQVAALVEQNIAVVCRGQGPSDQGFSDWGRIGIEWVLKENKIKTKLDRHERRRELFGIGWFKLHYDPAAIGGYGLPTIEVPSVQNVLVDLKVTDLLQLEDAEYLPEIMIKSKTWAKKEYGERANNIYFGGNDKAPIFQKVRTLDDEDAFYLIQLWTKTDGLLRKLEFSDDGVLLYDSFDDENMKDEEGNQKPYYRRNKYPYFPTILYPEEGKSIGFGDGRLLLPLQDMINDLYDQIRRAARPNRIFYDPDSEVDLEDVDDDDGPIPCRNPQQNIREVVMGNVNEALWRLLTNIHQEVQRVTRFSELMMGQGMSTKTATEASIQQQQGSSAPDHKKLMLQDTLLELCEYILDMLMEHTSEGRAFRVAEDKDEFIWVDFRQLNKIPDMMPSDDAYRKEYTEKNKNANPKDYEWMQLVDEEGNPQSKSVDLDIEISIGAGLPKNKAFLWQMAEKLSAMVVEGRNVVSYAELRKFIEDFLGLPLEDEQQQMPGQIPGMPGLPGQVLGQPMMNADVQGMTPAGNPAMSQLPPNPGVM
jgi:hypothetical protein